MSFDFTKRDPWAGVKPRRSIEIDPATRTVSTIVDFRDTQHNIPDRPLYLWCDYCLQPFDRLWCYPVKPFRVEIGPGKVIEQTADTPLCWWCACVYCKPLLESHDWNLLAARCRSFQPNMPADPLCIRLWKAVDENRTGDQPTVWNSGELRISKRQQCVSRDSNK